MIFLLSGKDKFRLQQKSQLALDEILAGEEKNGFNFQELVAPEISELCAVMQTPSFTSSNKVILVTDFKALENKSEDKEIEKIIFSLKQKPQNNSVIFQGEKINGTLKLVKKIKKDFKSEVREFKLEPFKSWDLKEASMWLIELSKELGATKLSYEIAEFIAEQVGVEDSAKLYNELKRVLDSGKELSIKALESELDAKSDVFKLIRYISQNQKAKANLEFNKLVKARELNIGLIALVETMLTNSLKLKLAEKKYINKNELASFLGISPGRLYHQQQELSQVTVEDLNSKLEQILLIERQVKTGKESLERAFRKNLLTCK